MKNLESTIRAVMNRESISEELIDPSHIPASEEAIVEENLAEEYASHKKHHEKAKDHLKKIYKHMKGMECSYMSKDVSRQLEDLHDRMMDHKQQQDYNKKFQNHMKDAPSIY